MSCCVLGNLVGNAQNRLGVPLAHKSLLRTLSLVQRTVMSNTTAFQGLDSTEEARRLLALAKTQRGGQKRLTEGARYLVITPQYINTYGHLLPEDEKQRLVYNYERWADSSSLKSMSSKPLQAVEGPVCSERKNGQKTVPLQTIYGRRNA
jgi:hypothetical protein